MGFAAQTELKFPLQEGDIVLLRNGKIGEVVTVHLSIGLTELESDGRRIFHINIYNGRFSRIPDHLTNYDVLCILARR